MHRIVRILAGAGLALSVALAPPAAAQEGGAVEDPLGEGMKLFERGAELFLRGLMDEIGPQLEQLRPQFEGMAEELGPMIAALLDLVDEIDAYHLPERLPNGDILLRRKVPPEPSPVPRDPPGEGEIDL